MRVLVVDDHALFRAGLRMLLATICRDAEIAEAADVEQALALAASRDDWQLCLLDLALRSQSGLQALVQLKIAAPSMAVVVVSAADDAATIRACLDAGAMSFIPKSLGPEVLTEALQHVLAGTVYLPAHMLQGQDDLPERPQLTPRQREVLLCLSRGLPTKLIARELALSEHTVKEHIALVFQALGARNRTEAVIKASRLRLVEPPNPP